MFWMIAAYSSASVLDAARSDTRVGFAEPLTPLLVATEQTGQVPTAFALPTRSATGLGRGSRCGAQDGSHGRQLLVEDGLVHRRKPAPSVLLGPRRAQPPARVERPLQAPIIWHAALVVARRRALSGLSYLNPRAERSVELLFLRSVAIVHYRAPERRVRACAIRGELDIFSAEETSARNRTPQVQVRRMLQVMPMPPSTWIAASTTRRSGRRAYAFACARR